MSAGNPFPAPVQFGNAGLILGRRNIITTAPFTRITSHGIETIPAGFISDGASIPQLAHSIIGHPFDVFLEDAVWHDYDYSSAGNKPRRLADRLFKETMWNRPIPRWKIHAIYASVHLFGGQHFKATPTHAPAPMSTPTHAPASKPTDKEHFATWFARQGFRHFQAHELTWYFQKVRNGVSNQAPGPALWPHIVPTLRILDDLRDHLGKAITISSTYRHLPYNQAIGSPDGSSHVQFKAIDFIVADTSPAAVFRILHQWREAGRFTGGLGKYPGFVHLDTRSKNATW